MTTKEIIEKFKKQNKSVYVKVEDGLYYPIVDIKQEGNNIIIYCPNLNKSYKHW